MITTTSRIVRAAAFAAFLAFGLILSAAGQAPPPPPAGAAPPPQPKVFLDWPGADIEAVKAEIPFVEFVPSLEDAEVRVTVVPQAPPPDGAFAIGFSGLKRFQGEDNRLRYVPAPAEKPEDVRKGVIAQIKIGLLRYAAKTPAAKDLVVRFVDQTKPTSVDDKWNFWVFSLSGNAFLSGETSYHSESYYGSFSANRTTPQIKVRTSVYGNLSKYRYDFGEGDIYESRTHGYGASALVVKSFGEHWSAGGYFEGESSTYSNIKLNLSVAPAIEYDVFPYSESTKRQLRILYRIALTRAVYREETIYFKTRETLVQEALSVAYEVVRPWGKAALELQGSNFLHDFSKNRIELQAEIEFRIWRGLSFEIDGSYARIRDQIALSNEGATYEDILLRRRMLATGYDYSFSVGLNFSFGSTKSNVVNPRFGTGGRSISISM
jgi:hypothetical protein